jgi:hypothetical protein
LIAGHLGRADEPDLQALSTRRLDGAQGSTGTSRRTSTQGCVVDVAIEMTGGATDSRGWTSRWRCGPTAYWLSSAAV